MGELQMTTSEAEVFLADVHVGILSVERDDGPPLTIPIWYDYRPGGDLWVLTDAGSLKGRLLASAGRFSLCAQTEALPYSYVSVEGSATIAPSDLESHLRPMARRYLGDKMGDDYTDNTLHGTQPIMVTMTPERWFSLDYGKLAPEESAQP